MSSLSSVGISGVPKQPLKLIEVPLNKFKEEVIPHHQSVFEQQKSTILKLISTNSLQRATKEVKNCKKIVKQLKDLMYELDTLRAQVDDDDLDKFDSKTLSLRKVLLNLITGYTELENTVFTLQHDRESEELNSKENCDPFDGVTQIQLQENLDELKLKQRQDVLTRVENVRRDVEDLHETYVQLNQIVAEQNETVEQIDESIVSTNDNVQSGLQQLVKAHKFKTAAYPVTGAFLGGIIGGPIGLVAGLKIGGLTAIGCAAVGYTSGILLKKAQQSNVDNNRRQNGIIEDNTNDDKKDI